MEKVTMTAQGKTFSFVQVTDEITGKYGEGIARRSKFDKQSNERGMEIAEGRARKALNMKINKKPIRNQFMG